MNVEGIGHISEAENAADSLGKFRLVSVNHIQRIMKKLPLKQSPADVLPLKMTQNQQSVCGVLTRIVNASLENGVFSESLKISYVTPVLKKVNLDTEDLANFRPVTNVSFISKIVESVVASQLTEHLEKISYLHVSQSAYRRFYSTETALLRVTSDWRRYLAENNMVCVVSLDVSAAFSTISHSRLMNKLPDAQVTGVA